jgi:hypothetical protein
MAQASSNNSTRSPIDSRRGFLTLAAGAAIIATTPAANALPADDATLLDLERQIFEQHDAAAVYDDEIKKQAKIWTAAQQRLYEESILPGGLSHKERYDAIAALPSCIEHSRLCRLQDPFMLQKDALVRQMFATPAHTADGRRAKVEVLIFCIMGPDWQRPEMDYQEEMARALLLEFVGGKPADELREQFV